MRPSLRTLVCILFLGLVACVSQASKPPVKTSYSPLVLISIDGFRADYFDRGLTPTLAELAKDGVRAQAMRSSFPTLTFPNHYTIVTGLYPDHHGIVNNRFLDPVSGKPFVYNKPETTSDPAWWGGEPIWVAAERQGKHAATMFWPGSDVAIDNVRPSEWMQFDKNKTPNDRVDQALGWFDLPPPQRPDFFTLYFETVDHEGHEHGPDSAEVNSALTQIDSALARLVDGLKQRGIADSTNIVIVSDHGMTAAGKDKSIVLDRIVDMSKISVVNTGVVAGLAAQPGQEAAVEKKLLAPQDHMRCWRKTEIPARLHYGTNSRIPPLLCLANDGWVITTQQYLDDPKHHFSHGEHGYDNDDPKMQALFIAHGPAFKRGLMVPEFDNVDVYPLLAHLLGIKPAANDGDFKVTQGMLR